MSDREHLYELAVCETTGLFPTEIANVTGGKYTHAYSIWGGGLGLRAGTYSMESGGLKWRDFDYWGSNNPTSRFDMDATRIAKLGDFIFGTAGSNPPYDFLGDFIVGLDDLTPAWMDRFWQYVEAFEDKHSPGYFCSAWVDAAFTQAGVTVISDPGRPYHGVTPMDLYRQFVKNGWANA